jgi:hypothetical protein
LQILFTYDIPDLAPATLPVSRIMLFSIIERKKPETEEILK